MTLETLINVFNETHPTNNLRCDGEFCKHSNSIVRIIPLDDSCNVNLCKDCFDIELGISIDREHEGLETILPLDVPFSVYPAYLGE